MSREFDQMDGLFDADPAEPAALPGTAPPTPAPLATPKSVASTTTPDASAKPADKAPDTAAPDTKDTKLDAKALEALGRKRRRYAVLAVAAVGFLLWHFSPMLAAIPGTSAPVPGASAKGGAAKLEVSEAARAAASDKLTEALAEARQYELEHHTFKGFKYPGVKVVGSTNALALIFTDGGCFTAALVEGVDPAVHNDATGAACTDEALKVYRAEFAANDRALGEAAEESAKARLGAAVQLAQYWAQMNLGDGQSPFTGLESQSMTDGVSVASAGSKAVLETEIRSGSCMVATVTTTSSALSRRSC